MALIKCKECGHDVSDKASACPNCGCPIEHTTGKVVSCPYDEQSKEGENIKSPNCDTPIKPETGNAVDTPIKAETGNAADTPAKPEADNVAENSMGKGDKNDDTLMRNGIIAIVVITAIGLLASQLFKPANTSDGTTVRETVENTSTNTSAPAATNTYASADMSDEQEEEEEAEPRYDGTYKFTDGLNNVWVLTVKSGKNSIEGIKTQGTATIGIEGKNDVAHASWYRFSSMKYIHFSCSSKEPRIMFPGSDMEKQRYVGYAPPSCGSFCIDEHYIYYSSSMADAEDPDFRLPITKVK